MKRIMSLLLYAVLVLFTGCMDSSSQKAASSPSRVLEAPLIETYPQSVSGDEASVKVRTLPNAAVYVGDAKTALADDSGAATLVLPLQDAKNRFEIKANNQGVFTSSVFITITKEALNNDGTTRLHLSYDTDAIASGSGITNLTLNVDTTQLLEGDITAVEVIATLNDGSTLNVTDDASWLVSNSTQMALAAGELQGLQEGVLIIQASYQEMLSKPIVIALLKEINGHILPPIPDSILNTATLEGIDSNNNGIRDDVERWVLETYQDYGCIATEVSLKGANLAQLITTQAQTPEDAQTLLKQVMDRMLNFQTDCAFDESKLLEAMNLLDSAFNAIQFDTPDRAQALQLFNSLWNTTSPQELMQQAQSYSQKLTEQLMAKGISEANAKAVAQKMLSSLYGFIDKLTNTPTGSSSSVLSTPTSSSSSVSSSASSVGQSSSAASSEGARIIGSVNTPGDAKSVTLSNDGTIAYVADGYSGLQIIDVSNSESPVIIGSVNTPGDAKSVTLSNDGTIAYVADDESGLQIIDISNPASPVIIGSVNTWGDAKSVTLSNDGTIAYVADDESGLQIIDVSNSESPVIIGSVNTWGWVQGVTLSSDGALAYVYVYKSSLELQIIDVSNPTSPVIIGSEDLDTPGYAYAYAYGITLSSDGTLAYIAYMMEDYSAAGLQIIDISNLASPVYLGSGWMFTTNPRGGTLSSDGTIAYVVDSFSGLQIIDVSDPAAPVIIDSVNTPGYTTDVTLSSDGTLAYVLNDYFGLQIIDVSTIVLPDKAPILRDVTMGVELNSSVGDVIGTVDFVYVKSISTLELSGEGAEDFSIDINGTIRLAQMLDENSRNSYNLKAIATNSVGSRESKVTIKIHSIPEFKDFNTTINSMSSEGTLVGQIDNNTTISDITLTGEGAEDFTIDTSGRIYVAPGKMLHHFVTPEYHLSVSATNGYGMHTGNVNITISAIISSVDTPNSVTGITLSSDGTLAYVTYAAPMYSRLQIIDISNPSAPVIIGRVNTPDYANGVTLSSDGSIAYVADGYSGVQIINVSNPSAPVIIGSVDTLGYAKGVTLSSDGSIAYVADGFSCALQIIDISNPSVPVIIGSVNTPDYATDVTLSSDGTIAYVSDGSSGLAIIDISNPSAPVIIGSVNTPGDAKSVTLSNDGSIAYVSDGSSGLQIIDVSNSESPVIIGSVNTLGYAKGVTLSSDGTIAYVADYLSGLAIIDLTGL